MPPKDFLDWGSSKMSLMNANGEIEAFGDFDPDASFSLCADDDREPSLSSTSFSWEFSGEAVWHRTKRRSFLQNLGYLKRPKLTYKTNRKYRRPKHHRKH
jgi:hypothetical protein